MSKNYSLLITVFLAIQFSSVAFACSPQLPFQAQQNNLEQVLNSETFKAELALQNRMVSISNITFLSGVNVHLNNGCTITGKLEFDRPVSNGLCPQFRGVTVNTVCENNL